QLLARQAEVSLANVRRFEHERLMVARLAELDGLKRDFIANVSHELRTPLTVIQGMGKTLANRWAEMAEETRAELLGRVNRNADARVAVSDNGPGIPAADLEHLGERFYRGSDVVARRSRGAGLGLAFARQVVELHGKELEIESELGRGSTFAFELPLTNETW